MLSSLTVKINGTSGLLKSSMRSIAMIIAVSSSMTTISLPASASPLAPNIGAGDRVNASHHLPQPQLIADNDTQPRRFGKGRVLQFREIDTVSGTAELAFAEYLAKSGVKFYGASWCKHCFIQKYLFGATAAEKLPYVECAPNGESVQESLCKKDNIERFPTWVVNGKPIVGTRNLKDIAAMTGYTGSTDFRYTK
jgi:hypothetical protein